MVWYSASAMQAIAELKSNGENGLADVQARKLLDNYGENRLESGKKDSVIKRFFAQFADFSVMILLVACVISFLTGFIEGKGDFIEPIVILAIVILNAAIGAFQEQRAEKAIEALYAMADLFDNTYVIDLMKYGFDNENVRLWMDVEGEEIKEGTDVVKGVNEKLPSYKKIARYKIRRTEFAKTTTAKIQRFKYSDKN